MPAERTVIYNRRTTLTGPESYADDDLDEELYVGRDDRIKDDRNTMICQRSLFAPSERVFLFFVDFFENLPR